MGTLVIPGGRGLRQAAVGEPVAKFIKARAATTRRIVSICTGIYGLAPTGLLQGRRVAAHWRFVKGIARQFPDLLVEESAIFLQYGPLVTLL